MDLSQYYIKMKHLSLSDFKILDIRRIVKAYNLMADCYNEFLKNCTENDIKLIDDSRYLLTVLRKYLLLFKDS